MRATTLRRAIVFGVCALGIGGLYLAPSMARSPDQIGSPVAPHDEPTSAMRTAPVSKARTRATVTASATVTRVKATTVRPASTTAVRTVTEEPTESEVPEASDEPTSSRPSTPSASRTGATAVDPNEPPQDDTPPAAVPKIKLTAVTPDHLTIHWEAAEDNVGVAGYRVWLNGFPVADTQGLQVTVDWFNDDGGQHVVQVRALDAAGNQSENSPSVLITRPDPSPTPNPPVTPMPTDTPVSPEPTPDPNQPTSVQETPTPTAEELPGGGAVGPVQGAPS